MQGAQHQVARQRRAHGDVGGFAVADFADHDDVGVLAQDRAQRLGEIEADVGLDGHLVDARHQVFHGVFHRLDVDLRRTEVAQGAVERRSLAAAGGAREQDDAVRFLEDALEARQHVRFESDILHVHQQRVAVQDAQHELLAVDLGERGHAHVDDPPVDAVLEAAVQRQAPLGDVHVRQDLDAGDDAGIERLGRRRNFAQDAVDAQADGHVLLVRLEMHVAGAVAHRLQEQQVDEAHHGRVVGQHAQLVRAVARFLHAGHHVLHLGVGDLAQVALDVGFLGVGAVDDLADPGLAADRLDDVARGQGTDRVEGVQVQRVLHHQRDRLVAPLPAREDAEAAGDGLGQQLDFLPLKAEILADLEVGNAQLHREGAGDVVLGHVAQVAQHFAQRPAGRVRGADGLLQLGRGDFPRLDQEIA